MEKKKKKNETRTIAKLPFQHAFLGFSYFLFLYLNIYIQMLIIAISNFSKEKRENLVLYIYMHTHPFIHSYHIHTYSNNNNINESLLLLVTWILWFFRSGWSSAGCFLLWTQSITSPSGLCHYIYCTSIHDIYIYQPHHHIQTSEENKERQEHNIN